MGGEDGRGIWERKVRQQEGRRDREKNKGEEVERVIWERKEEHQRGIWVMNMRQESGGGI